MASHLDRWVRQATLLKPPARLLDALELADVEARRWKKLNHDLHVTGDPTALAGGFAGLELTPVPGNSATVTINATEAVIIPTAQLAIAANPQVPKFYRLFAAGTSTTAATPGTFTLTPRIGPSPTNASPLIGVATAAITPVASATAAPWRLEGWLLIRTGGSAAIAAGSFEFNMSSATATGGPASATANAVFGGVSAAFDSTVASALWIGSTATTSTTNTFTPQVVAWASYN